MMSSRLSGLLPLAAAIVVIGCDRAAPADAYGNFEAEEVAVAAQASGQLSSFMAVEGAKLTAGEVVATLDTLQQALDRDQTVSQRSALEAQRREAAAQETVLRVQLEIAERAWARTQRLLAGGAATAVQRDQSERDVRVLRSQIGAVRATQERLTAESRTVEVRSAAARDRLRRTTVVNPVTGTVLTTHVRAGETVAMGQPLYRLADLDTLTLRVYVTGTQLPAVRIGATVDVHVDSTAGLASARPGVVSWVSPRAEFTPTPVQTRDERADLVYAVKVRVANSDGALKVGMPADISLRDARAFTSGDRPTP
jgi:HlyD family secretion protein